MSKDKVQTKKSLSELTLSFMEYLAASDGADIDLTEAAASLGAQKRRLYDVINVLAGASLIEKTGKSRVKSISTHASQGGAMPGVKVDEAEIDRLTSVIDQQLLELSRSDLYEQFGWVTDDDIVSLDLPEGIALFSLKGPESLQIEVPQGSGNGEMHQLVIKCDDGPIELTPIKQKGH